MNENPVRWFEIYVQDMARAKTFYEAVLGAEMEALSSPGVEMFAFPMHKGQRGASGSLVRREGTPSGGNSTLVYFGCEDCAVEAARVLTAGGSVLREKFSIGEFGFCALAVDSEGNVFGLHSMT